MLVTKETDIVVEGFPRCANTFAVAYLSVTNRESLTIARHTHTIAQVKMALGLRKPTVILLREPLDAMASWAVRDQVPIKHAITEYVSFYSFIEKYHSHLLIIDFATLISEPSALPERINRRFALGLSTEPPSPEVLSRVANLVESMERDYSGPDPDFESKVSRPSEGRAAATAAVKSELKKHSDSVILARAMELYRRLSKHEKYDC